MYPNRMLLEDRLYARRFEKRYVKLCERTEYDLETERHRDDSISSRLPVSFISCASGASITWERIAARW